MRLAARSCALVFAIILSYCCAQADHRRPVGVVSQADNAHIDTTNAMTGADVYDCENLTTDEGGELRLQVHSGQVHLTGGSSAQLEEDINEVQVFINRGTVGFAEPAGTVIEITTPGGFVRAASGQAAAGEVKITSATEMLVTAIRGDLVLDNGGEFRTIAQGQSAKITFEGSLEPVCRVAAAGNQPQSPLVHRPIGFYLIAAGAVAVPAIVIWHEESESDTKVR